MVKLRRTKNGANFLGHPVSITLFLYKIDTNFACMVGFTGSTNSNMLSKFSREPRELS